MQLVNFFLLFVSWGWLRGNVAWWDGRSICQVFAINKPRDK